MTGERTEKQKAQIRGAAMVIAIAMASWMGLSFLGGQLGWPIRFAFLIDMLCLAAFVWALWVIIRVWRAGAGKGN